MVANSGDFKFHMVCTAQNPLCFWEETYVERHLVKVTVMH